MQYKIYKNDWVIELQEDLKQLTHRKAIEISSLLRKYPLVIAKNQKLQPKDELEIFKLFDPPYKLMKEYNISDNIIVPGTNGLAIRVTAKKNKKGIMETFCDTKGTSWHCDNPYPHPRRILTYLYAVQGVEDSVTLWSNTKLAFDELDPNLQKFLKKSKIKIKNFTPTSDDTKEFIPVWNENGEIHLPIGQIECFENLDETESKEIIEHLKTHMTKENYVYKHKWNLGDVLFANQRLGNHKRLAFDNMENRILHKSSLGFAY